MTDMEYEQILYEVDDPVATITLNRPDALNAWTGRMAAEVRHAVGRAENDAAVVGIVLTGAGRGFCAGADFKLLATLSEGNAAEDLQGPAGLDADAGDPSWGNDLRGEYTYLLSVPKPVVAAINGAVAGTGLAVVLSCDLRYMAEDAVLTTSFAQLGLVAEWGTSWLLPRLVGPAVALDLLFSARKVDGVEAAQLGLVNRALPAAEVLDAARSYIVGLAERCSPRSLATMKRQVYQQLHAGLEPAEREAQILMYESAAGDDFAEAMQSFRETRPPRFERYTRD